MIKITKEHGKYNIEVPGTDGNFTTVISEKILVEIPQQFDDPEVDMDDLRKCYIAMQHLKLSIKEMNRQLEEKEKTNG